MVFRTYFARLLGRIVLFAAAVVTFFVDRDAMSFGGGFRWSRWMSNLIWLILMLSLLWELVRPVIPRLGDQFVSIGIKKQLKKYYIPSSRYISAKEQHALRKKQDLGAWKVLCVWAAGNSIVAALWFFRLIGREVLLLLSLAYFVGDLVCVVLYCPFQSLFLHNRCCADCRIFAWDSIMMCTPLLFIRSFYSWSLCAVALLLLVRWEWAYRRHPERFNDHQNARLTCSACNERLCRVRGGVTRHVEKALHIKER